MLALALCVWPASAQRTASRGFRLLSWNVSGRMPVERGADFRGHLQLASPDVVVLDEVDGSLSGQAIHDALAPSREGSSPAGAAPATWHLTWGERGGRQRVVIAARVPVETVADFQRNAYAETDVAAVLEAAPEPMRAHIGADMAHGLATNAAVVRIDGRRLLVVGADVQCCGLRWQELRRLAEVRHLRSLIGRAIDAMRPDGVILAGDFNLASPAPATAGIGALPLVVVSGPYPPPIHALLAAEALHRDGHEAWTINGGERSPFPHLPFDFQLYSPLSLKRVAAYVMDTADYPAAELQAVGLSATASREFSEHRPVVVSYAWQGRR
jgi:endonuclease/exonuclease/phosphatase family metal-dependent hydrolase